jgi:hypothetical protein
MKKNILAVMLLSLVCLERAVAQTDNKQQQSKTADDERIAREIYAKGAHRGKKHKTLNDNYWSFTLGYDAFSGGNAAPFKSGIAFRGSDGYLIIKNHALIDVSVTTNLLYHQNNQWIANAFSLLPGQSIGNTTGFAGELQVGLMPVLINKKHVALAAGLVVGGYVGTLPDAPQTTTDSYSGENIVLTATYGVKALLTLGGNFLTYAEYVKMGHPSIGTSYFDANGLENGSVAANCDYFRVGIGYRLSEWWF